MREHTGKPKRIAVAGLALVLAALLVVGLWRHTLDLRTIWLLIVGIVLGGLYAIYPNAYRRALSTMDWLRNNDGPIRVDVDLNIADDDAPGNISPKVYLPILLLVILAAAATAFVCLRR